MSSSHGNKPTANGRKPNGSFTQHTDSKESLGIDPLLRREKARVLALKKERLAEILVAQKSCVDVHRVRAIDAAELEFSSRLRHSLRVRLAHIVITAVEQLIADVEKDCYEEYIEEFVAGGRWKKEEVA